MAARETKQHNKEKALREMKEKALREVAAAERAAIEKYLARLKAKPLVRFKVSKQWGRSAN